MEYNSFYGGRRGTSFVLVKSFPDIPSMVAQFERGGDYTEVNYDEYVIINTVNKNHPDNGKIFRRGYDYNSSRTIVAYKAYCQVDYLDETKSTTTRGTDRKKIEIPNPQYDPDKPVDPSANPKTIKPYFVDIINGTAEEYAVAVYQKHDIPAAGAIYQGTIVGPAGRAPMLELTTYDDARIKQAARGFDERKSYGEWKEVNLGIVPGKISDNEFNDNIKWYCTSIRNANDEDTTAYIGLQIPYDVIEFKTHRVEPYNSSGNYADRTSIERAINDGDDGTHPFYQKWNIAIPDGVKGQSFRNFRVTIPQQNDKIYSTNLAPTSITPSTPNYDDFNDDRQNNRQILVYDYYRYDKVKNPTPITYYIGDYNQISDIAVQEDGTLIISYTHDPADVFSKRIKWINTVLLNSTQGGTNEGLLTVSFNDGSNYTTRLKWVNDITLADNGQITLHYSGNGTNKVITNTIKWVDNVSINTGATEGTGNQKVHVTYNNGSSADVGQPLNYIMKTKMTDDKHMILLYSDPARRAALKSGQLTPVYQTIDGSYEVDGFQGWLDLGSFHVDSGILVGLDVAAEDMPAGTDINEPGDVINYLNSAYPEGLTGENLEDKIVTAGTTGNKIFYGYNYDTHEWYSLGTISGYEIATIEDIDKMMEDELPSEAVVGTAIVGKDIIVAEDGQ